MDYKNLEYFIFIKMLNQYQIKWTEFLIDFNFCVIYKSENKIICSNIFSQKAKDYLIHTNPNNNKIKNQFQIVFPEDIFDIIIFYDFIV